VRMASVPIITGPPGCGKSRLAEEAAKVFVSREPSNRHAARLSIDSSDILTVLRRFGANEASKDSDFLGAALLCAMFADLQPKLYDFEWKDVERLILASLRKHLCASDAITLCLIVDDFSADLTIATKLFRSSLAAIAGGGGLKVVPLFAGVPTTLLPTEMSNLLGLGVRVSAQASTTTILLSNLSSKAEESLIRGMASAWEVPFEDVIHARALGCVLPACGGSPWLLMLLHSTLKREELSGILGAIKAKTTVDTTSLCELWNALVSEVSARLSVVKLAQLVCPNKKVWFKSELLSTESHDSPSLTAAREIMLLLDCLALTGVPVELRRPMVTASELSHLDIDVDSPELAGLDELTFQRARSLVEITPIDEEDVEHELSSRGRVRMPLFVFFACFPQSRRDTFNPFLCSSDSHALLRLALENMAAVLLTTHEFVVPPAPVPLEVLRPHSRRWGPEVFLASSIPSDLVQLTDQSGCFGRSLVEVEPKEVPVEWEDGLFFIMAGGDSAEGGAILTQADTDVFVIIVTQTRFEWESTPPSSEVNGKASLMSADEAKNLLLGLRERAAWLKDKQWPKADQRAIVVYDLVMTRTSGERFPQDKPDLFGLEADEVLLLTTKDTLPATLGPPFSVLVTIIVERRGVSN
jgi:hypothetical protein